MTIGDLRVLHNTAAVLASIGCLFYLVILLSSLFLVRHHDGRGTTQRTTVPARVSVVVAALNEERRITPLLQSLACLDYPENHLEVIIVDDCSSDGTCDIVEAFCKDRPNWRLRRMGTHYDEPQGQMAALSAGIGVSDGEIIITTDADCVVPRQWIWRILDHFSPTVSMVLGHCPLVKGEGGLHRFLAFDKLISAVSQLILARIGFPHGSTGGNLAYRRSCYDAVGGYSAVASHGSGCDTHMTLLFHSRRCGRIVYCTDPGSFVETRLPESFTDNINRQIRRNSETFKKPLGHILFSIGALCSYLSPFALLFMDGVWSRAGVIVLGARFSLELICLARAARVFGAAVPVWSFVAFQMIYVPHLIVFGTLGLFRLYRWKGMRPGRQEMRIPEQTAIPNPSLIARYER